MTTVELVYALDCPNVGKARANLMKALVAAGRETRWTEWDCNAPKSPPYVKSYGSPTILIGRRDVAGEVPANEGSCCRLYRNGANQLDRAPSVQQIEAALRDSESLPPVSACSSGWRNFLATVPGIAFAFLPKLACPACWPAYAGLLGSVGLGFLLETAYLFPLTAAFLVLAVGALAFRARTRRGYGPFAVGLAAAATVLLGKFGFDYDVAMYGGIGLLVAASVWNAWPVRRKDGGCPTCVADS